MISQNSVVVTDAVRAAVLEQGDDQAGRAHGKHRAHHDQQHHAEHAHHVLHEAAQIDAGDLGDGSAVVALAHHAGEDSRAQPPAKMVPKVIHRNTMGPHRAPCMAPKMGPRPAMFSSWIMKQLPLGQDHIVHAVVDLYGRRFTVVGAEGILHDLAVQEVAADQQSKTDQKTNHIVSSLHNDTKGFPGCSPGAARGNSRSAGTFFRTNITAITDGKRFRLRHTTLSYLFCEKSQQSESTKSSQNFFAIFTENSHFAHCR